MRSHVVRDSAPYEIVRAFKLTREVLKLDEPFLIQSSVEARDMIVGPMAVSSKAFVAVGVDNEPIANEKGSVVGVQ